jgi:uncharacterized delta-60 repeat protein
MSATPPRDLPDLGLRTSGYAYQLATQTDGRLIVAGAYYEVGNARATNLARLNVDGSLDAGWSPTVQAAITAIAVSTGSDLYVATWPSAIVKISLTGTGTSDATFWFSNNFSETVYALAVDANFLYAANASGEVRRYDATTGNRDFSWTCAAAGSHLIPDHAGHMYVDARRVNLSDGTLDANWTVPAIDYGLTATALGSDGYLYVGSYYAIGAGGIEGLARLQVNSHGAIDDTWHPVSPGDAANSLFNAILPLDDGSVVVGGVFDRLGGGTRRNLARLDGIHGNVDASWHADVDSDVMTLSVGPSNSIFIGGYFTTIAGTPRASVARLATNGTTDISFAGGLYAGATVAAITPDPAHGRTYVGGQFDWAGDQPHRNILRFDDDGGIDSTWTPATDSPSGPPFSPLGGVHAIAVSNTDVYIGGQFSTVNGVTRQSLAKLSAAAPAVLDAGWNPHPEGTYANVNEVGSSIDAIALDSQGRLLIGGDFRKVADADQEMLARINTDGTIDSTWLPDPVYPVRRLAYDGDNSLFFIVDELATGRSYPGKVALDSGVFDFAWDQMAHVSQAYDIAFARSGVVYLATSEPSGTSHVVRLFTSTGATDPTWAPMLDCPVARIAFDNSDIVYAAGNRMAGSEVQACLQRITSEGVVESSFAPSWLPDSHIWAVAVGNGGVAYVGGRFGSVSGVGRRSLAAFDGADSIFSNDFEH